MFTYAEMATKRQNKKQDLMDAAVRLVARKGVRGTTVRSIAREAGVTEGALYRHYASKAELCLDIYTRIVMDMIRAKEAIAFSDAPVRNKLREWVRVSYEFFDRHADAFTFVLLTPHEFTETERQIAALQGLIFTDLVERAQASGELRHMPPELALSHFSGVMLNVPRLIAEGTLQGPASKFVDDVAEAVWRMLCAEPSRHPVVNDTPVQGRLAGRARRPATLQRVGARALNSTVADVCDDSTASQREVCEPLCSKRKELRCDSPVQPD